MGLQRRPGYEGPGNEEYLSVAEELRRKIDGNIDAAGLEGSEAGSVVYRIDDRHSYELFNPDLPAYVALLRRPDRPGAKPVLHLLLQELIKMPQKNSLGQAYAHVRLSSRNDIKARHYSEILITSGDAEGFEDETLRGAMFIQSMDETAEVGRKLYVSNLRSIENRSIDPAADNIFNRTRLDKFYAINFATQLVDAVSEEAPLHVEAGTGCDL